MKIVVTGGSGMLGQAVITELREHGYEVLNLDQRTHPNGFRPTWTGDLQQPGSLYEACRGAAGIIHLAAYNAPGLTADYITFNSNVAITYNVLKAAADCGVRRVVFGSSTAAYGFIYGPEGKCPDYLPVDEVHPSTPTDSYGLSKVVGERISQAFAIEGRLSVVALRFPGINFDPEFRLLKERMADPGGRRTGFWAYVDVRDAAAACRLALEVPLEGAHLFNVAAPNTSMREPTEELIRRFYPGVSDTRSGEGKHWSGIDPRRAERDLGFRAHYLWDN